jgi:hypothetical protein
MKWERGFMQVLKSFVMATVLSVSLALIWVYPKNSPPLKVQRKRARSSGTEVDRRIIVGRIRKL